MVRKYYTFKQFREMLFVITIILISLLAILLSLISPYKQEATVYELWLSNYSSTVEKGENITFFINSNSESNKLFSIAIYFDSKLKANFLSTLNKNSIKVNLPNDLDEGRHRISVVVFDTSTGDWFGQGHQLFYTVNVL